jgi:asparagine synthase (glutamine-hydrolysing)
MMCGFVGCYPHNDKQGVRKAVRRLAHRGPDEQHVIDTRLGSLGHARLSILDVDGSHQPMKTGQHWIVFNGEIYNFLELRQRLLSIHWQTNGDTEVVLNSFLSRGPEILHELDGMFAFAIFDDGLFLARDPIGIKPLYYARSERGMYFASEIKALLDAPGDIHEFPAGHWWDAAHGFVRYFHMDDLKTNAGLPGDLAKSELDEIIRFTLRRAVQKRLIADPGVPVGVSLSGGLDSSLIAALAREGRDVLDTFVVGMQGSEDITRSCEVAKALGTRHQVYQYDLDEMLRVLPEVIYHLESFDAALVRSAIPNYFLARLAADHVKVILTGEGADELFGGYAYLRDVDDPRRFQRELWTITSGLHNTNLQRTDRMTMAHGIEGRVPFLDREMIRMALSLPPELKFHNHSIPEKAILRRAFAGFLPANALHRPKQKFSQGAGSMEKLVQFANLSISAEAFEQEQMMYPEARLRSREELLYFHIFREQFGDRIPPGIVGRTLSVTSDELN